MSRRGAWVAGTALVGAALLALGAVPWLRVTVETAIAGDGVVTVAGGAAVPAVPGSGLALLAAGAALGLAGRVGRVLAAVTVSVVGVLLAVTTAAFLADPAPAAQAAAAAATGVRRDAVEAHLTAWPTVTLAVAAAAGVGGVLAGRASRAWPSAAGRYERPTPQARPSDGGPARARDDWDALSRGEDPS